MKRKKHYTSPEVDILHFLFDDIILTSGEEKPDTDDNLDLDIGEWDGEM